MQRYYSLICGGIFILWLSWHAIAQEILQNEILLSSPRNSFTSIEVDGKIYFAGGFENGDLPSATIDVFDIATQTWNDTLQLSEPRGFVTPAVIPPHIYFVGGFRSVIQTKGYSYQPGSTGTWNELFNSNIKDPVSISVFGTTLMVLGEYGAEFTDLADTSRWTSNAELNNVMQRIVGGIKFSHDDLIFIFGGVNVSSRQPVSDAWIYDISTDNVTHYSNVVINPIGHVSNEDYSYSAENDIVAVWMKNGECALVNLQTHSWLNLVVSNISNIISVPESTFIFNSSGYYTIDWTSNSTDATTLPFTSSTGRITAAINYANQTVYFENEQDYFSRLHCYSNGAWTPTQSTFIPGQINRTLNWPSRGAVLTTDDGYYIINNCTVGFISARVLFADVYADLLYVLTIQGFGLNKVSVYNSTLHQVTTFTVPESMSPDLVFDNLIIDFEGREAIDNRGIGYELFMDIEGTNPRWTVNGEHLITVFSKPSIVLPSLRVDIYNYEDDTWLAPKTAPSDRLNTGFNQAFNMNGILGIFTNKGILKLNILNDSNFWSEEPFSTDILDKSSVPNTSIAPLVAEVNGTVYATTTRVELKIWGDGGLNVVFLSNEDPTQIIHHKPTNQLLISTSPQWIYTWNIDTQTAGSGFLFPRIEPEFFSASSGNFLLASALTSELFEYCDLSSVQWGNVTGVQNYFRPSTMRSFTFNGTDLILTAGGQDKVNLYYTDSVRIFDISSLQAIPAPPTSPLSSNEPAADSPRSVTDDTTLIVAIVVPVGAVLIGGGLLAFLIRRRKKRQNNGHQMSTMGLEQQYGQWFIPFTSLTFHEQLGQGASGQVFKGTWNNTTVALKLSMTQANNSVIDELTLMMQLRPHPNVVQLLGFSVHPETDSIVLVIEYCNQGALDDMLFSNKTSVPLKQKLEWLIGIAKGLSHLHSNNIVHRDVAARNVLMHQNEAKLTDFGMSRIVDSQQQRGTTKSELGPIRWMSPESLKSKEYSTKSDVWSFGIVAYEIIAQQEPHADQDPIQVGQMIRDSGLTPQLPDTCPSDLASAIKSCWNTDPSKRPTIEQITSELENAMSHL